jgi:hypothetical protein
MIRIAITPAGYAAIAATLALDPSVHCLGVSSTNPCVHLMFDPLLVAKLAPAS